MRAELARPGLQFLSPEQYNELIHARQIGALGLTPDGDYANRLAGAPA